MTETRNKQYENESMRQDEPLESIKNNFINYCRDEISVCHHRSEFLLEKMINSSISLLLRRSSFTRLTIE